MLVNITDEFKKCAKSIFRWRQSFNYRGYQKGAYLYLPWGKDGRVGPQFHDGPNWDGADWYMQYSSWSAELNPDGRSARFSDTPRFAKETLGTYGVEKIKMDFRLELVMVDDWTVKSGGKTVWFTKWGFEYSETTHLKWGFVESYKTSHKLLNGGGRPIANSGYSSVSYFK